MKKILLVDDSKDIIISLIDLVEESGHQAFYCYNAIEALKLAHEIIPDLILCDILMPQMDGFEFLERIKNDPRLSHIPFIFMSAKASKADIEKGIKSGIYKYITKPFDIVKISGVIEEAISSR